jgi:hypothetical protein
MADNYPSTAFRPDDDKRFDHPAPWARYADFMVTRHGDGRGATLLHGWEALCQYFIACHYFRPDAEQREEVMVRLTDWEQWETLDDHTPFHLFCSYEDGGISVTRVTDASPDDVDVDNT